MSTTYLPSTDRTAGVLSGRTSATFFGSLHTSRGNLSAAISLLLALFLVVSLNVSGTFLITKQVSAASATQLAQVWDHSHDEHLAKGAGEGKDTVPSPKVKRLRGALASKTVAYEIVNFLVASLVWSMLLIEDADPGSGPIFVSEPEPVKGYSLPQELLRRPPPTR